MTAELSASARRVFDAFAQLRGSVRVLARSFAVFYPPGEFHRQCLMGPLRPVETRAEQARRHRELKWINARNRRRRSTP